MNRQISPLFRLLLCLVLAASFSGRAQTVVSSALFSRGTGSDPSFHSFVIPLDGEGGVTGTPSLATTLPNIVGVSTIYHLNITNSASQSLVTNRIPVLTTRS